MNDIESRCGILSIILQMDSNGDMAAADRRIWHGAS